jgi:hypothetical protein
MNCVAHKRQALTIIAAVALGFSVFGSSMAFAQVSGSNSSGASIGSSGAVSSTGSGAVSGYSSTGASAVGGYSATGLGAVSGNSSMGSSTATGTGAFQIFSRAGVANSTTGTIGGGATSSSCLSLDASLAALLSGC